MVRQLLKETIRHVSLVIQYFYYYTLHSLMLQTTIKHEMYNSTHHDFIQYLFSNDIHENYEQPLATLSMLNES